MKPEDKYTRKEIEKVRSVTRKMLENNEGTRNCDTLLAFEGMYDMGYVKKTIYGYLLPYENLNKVPALEDWKRIRADYQHRLGLYPCTIEKVTRRRKTRTKSFKNLNKLKEVDF